MSFLQSIDVALFNFFNQSISNPVFDWLMPFLSGNRLFIPFVLVMAVFLIWKHKTRGILCVVFCLLVVGIGDGWIINTIKHLVGRMRPFHDIEAAITLVGRTGSPSFPSAHSANAFAVSMVILVFYRNSWKFMLPLAFGIAFSRVYNGVHYPSDTIVGSVLGAGYALGIVWILREGWMWAGPKWFPIWWSRLPDLIDPERREELPADVTVGESESGANWLRLGYILIGFMFVFRLWYISAGKIELSEDEVYQWQWSQHLALSYFSKPPLIAYTQAFGTGIWGDNDFGVRFMSPVIAAILGLCLLRFLNSFGRPREGFWLVLLLSVTPLTAVGSILMVIDALSVSFWALAMMTGWLAIRDDSAKAWLFTGLWLGLGFLAKYTALFQLVSFVLFFALLPEARCQFRKKGIYLALGMVALSTVPVLLWNAQNDWITITHLESRAGLTNTWRYNWNFMQDFIVQQLSLLNPIFCIATVWAGLAFWKRYRDDKLMLYLFCMGAPLFVGYFLYTVRSRVQPNWIAPSIVPLFALLVLYWGRRFDEGVTVVKKWLIAGLAIGLPVVIVLHDTNIPGKLFGTRVPPKYDPLVRVRGWSELGRVVEEQRLKMEGQGTKTFLIGSHYGITSVLAFYIPGANEGVPGNPLVYYQTADHPENQYYFWQGYEDRKGQDALYVRRLKLGGDPEETPDRISKQFESVEDLGVFGVNYRGREIHRVHLVACRKLQ